MSNIYYPNIYNSVEEGEKFYRYIKNSVTPYEVFVKNAITSLKNKEDIKAKWKKIGGELVQLHLKGQKKFYKTIPISIIEVKSDTLEAGIFEITEENEGFNFKEDRIEFISVKDRYKEDVTITEMPYYKKGKKIIHLKMDNIDIITSGTIYKLRDGFDDIKLIPLWLEKEEEIHIESIIQEDIPLDYEVTVDGRIAVKALNLEKPVYINGEKKEFKIHDSFSEEVVKDYQTLKHDGELYIISDKRPDIEGIEIKEEAPLLPFEEFIYVDEEGEGKNFQYNSIDSESQMRFIVDTSKKLSNYILEYRNLQFSVEKLSNQKNDKELFRIQLEEIDEITDDILSNSPLEHFFEDSVEIYEGDNYSKGRKFEVLPYTSNTSEFSFILTEKSKTYKKNPIPIFPKEETLRLRLNTYQLERQLEALNIFINKPLSEQKPLLNLFKPLKEVNWKNFQINSLNEEDWFVLRDGTRSGCLDQRKFVERAISTTDFMLLEGPPGSGKTTAILELICQLTKKGKRVLLCGSTHVAIDNVLERLKKERLLEDILPIRVGDEKRISEDVSEFQMANVVKSSRLDERTILDSANLVCGTTLGILQHPHFKSDWRDRKYINIKGKTSIKVRDRSIYPDYDYLIIDESSKTTFNEFLVPALFAKKWILVGDVKQLAPFTDRDAIESNIKNLNIGNKVLSEDLQEVCFLLKELCFKSNRRFKFITVMKKKEIPHLVNEVNKRNFNGKRYLIIDNKISKTSVIGEEFAIKTSTEVKEEALYYEDSYDGIFIEKNLLKELEDYLPSEFLLLRSDSREVLGVLLRQNCNLDYLERYYLKDRGRNYTGREVSKQLNDIFKEKSWASEMAWKMVRSYELKGVGGKKANSVKNLQKDLKDLTPKSLEKVEGSLFILNQVTLPSILESLQRGIDKREAYHSTTTLTEGFTRINKYPYLKNRFITLKYQHRMHPQISKTPRELFYNSEALNDSHQLDRKWSFDRYPARNIWINHNTPARSSSNKEEVTLIRKELEQIRRWRNNDTADKPLTIGILTFYRRQEKLLREMLQDYCTKHSKEYQGKKMSQFYLKDNSGKKNIEIKLYTVDKFQGQEADIIFLSMVNTKRDGFMDNPNRLNVAITRARYQMIYVGMISYYQNRSQSSELRDIAEKTREFRG